MFGKRANELERRLRHLEERVDWVVCKIERILYLYNSVGNQTKQLANMVSSLSEVIFKVSKSSHDASETLSGMIMMVASKLMPTRLENTGGSNDRFEN